MRGLSTAIDVEDRFIGNHEQLRGVSIKHIEKAQPDFKVGELDRLPSHWIPEHEMILTIGRNKTAIGQDLHQVDARVVCSMIEKRGASRGGA